jgi:hypothetical protein
VEVDILAKKSKPAKGKLIAKSFPEMGNMMPSYAGSQSNPPVKTDPFDPETAMGPSLDRMSYGPGS